MRYITESDIPYFEAFLNSNRFIMLNMYPDGIWLVDSECSKWNEIKNTALLVARTFGDKEGLKKIEEFKK